MTDNKEATKAAGSTLFAFCEDGPHLCYICKADLREGNKHKDSCRHKGAMYYFSQSMNDYIRAKAAADRTTNKVS